MSAVPASATVSKPKARKPVKGGKSRSPRSAPSKQSVQLDAFREIEKLSFTGHQTFSFRYAWLAKGVHGVKEDRELFFQDDALVTLGVGKNMVDSIRFWCEALSLIEVDGRNRSVEILPLGELLFGARRNSKGVDPYLEDPATLWILHWQLASRPDLASTWYLAFTRWSRTEFTRDELVRWVWQTASQGASARSSEASIKRDVEVFLRTYIPAAVDRRRPVEDSFDCPLSELGLMSEIERNFYQFNLGPKPSLPIDVLTFAILEFWRRSAPQQRTLNIERLLFDPGSPGAAFKLSDKALIPLLEKIPEEDGLRYDETAGLRVLIRTDQADLDPVAPFTILKRYYTTG
jgi:hypothetical protein